MKIIGRLVDYYNRVMDLPDAPSKVALGAALGLAFDFLPIPIISIPIAFLVARLLGGNGLAGALSAAFFKWAVPFFYVLNVATGNLLLNFALPDDSVTVAVMDTHGPWMEQLVQLGVPFLVGAAVNALLAWLALYFIVRRLLLLRHSRKSVKRNEMNC
ncbi:hypothetical protein SPSYN_00737 [Sporotomaculum syntrophicum]|uniref:DUF2062 domain-containing protein n=1 Tax=Sporotomaculum syntrophicum TaxID=182264 RepID=A0A9D2WRF2_9FIRM|nr:DUF2062 domain-containing protein [Sporotomaculum syntrophicum]KAF1085999.1 hypothetical protein SPSYN_00737 [Sporotomaculum syntrophicum]